MFTLLLDLLNQAIYTQLIEKMTGRNQLIVEYTCLRDMDAWLSVFAFSPWSSSRAWFQTRMHCIACLTGSSTSGRASPSHWESEEQSSALKEVRTQCFFIQPQHFLRAMCRCTTYLYNGAYYTHNILFSQFIFYLSLCLQRSVRQRFSMKCFLMKNLLEVSTSGTLL